MTGRRQVKAGFWGATADDREVLNGKTFSVQMQKLHSSAFSLNGKNAPLLCLQCHFNRHRTRPGSYIPTDRAFCQLKLRQAYGTNLALCHWYNTISPCSTLEHSIRQTMRNNSIRITILNQRNTKCLVSATCKMFRSILRDFLVRIA